MRGFSSIDNPNHKGKTNTWLTPLWIINSLGRFDLDPCGYPGHKTADKLITLPNCGLKQAWLGRVWLNPPYGNYTGLWLRKLKEHGNGTALVFSRTDTKWFQSCGADAYFFIKGRIKFLNHNLEEKTNAGHGSVLLAYGKNNIDAIKTSKIKGVLLKTEVGKALSE